MLLFGIRGFETKQAYNNNNNNLSVLDYRNMNNGGMYCEWLRL